MAQFRIKLDEGAKMPVRAHEGAYGDVGYDIHAKSISYGQDTVSLVPIFANGSVQSTVKSIPSFITVDTGVHIQPVDPNYWVELKPNSRTNKLPIIMSHVDNLYGNVGTIDPGYTGPIRIIFNTLPGCTHKILDEFFKEGAVMGQLVVHKRYSMDFVEEEFIDTTRQDNGFGSTDTVRNNGGA